MKRSRKIAYFSHIDLPSYLLSGRRIPVHTPHRLQSRVFEEELYLSSLRRGSTYVALRLKWPPLRWQMRMGPEHDTASTFCTCGTKQKYEQDHHRTTASREEAYLHCHEKCTTEKDKCNNIRPWRRTGNGTSTKRQYEADRKAYAIDSRVHALDEASCYNSISKYNT